MLFVMVDDENCALQFWDALREQYPKIAEALSDYGMILVSRSVANALESLFGFADGPAHAPKALLFCEYLEDLIGVEVLDNVHIFATPK